MHSDGIFVEQFHFTKDLRIDGFQAVTVRSEYDQSWVSSSFMIKDGSALPYEKADYVGRSLLRNGEDITEETDNGIEIYDGLEVRFGTTLSSTQGESVENGIFTRARYINPLDNNRLVKSCDVQQDTCQVTTKVTHKPVAKDGNKTYFARSWNTYQDGNLSSTHRMIYVTDKAETIEIPQLNTGMLFFGLTNEANGESWSSRESSEGYSLEIGDSGPLPYTFADGKMTVRMLDGFVYNIELVPGSNTKDGITFCQYLASESCDTGEQIRLNYPNFYQ
jgi:hypothetical protein